MPPIGPTNNHEEVRNWAERQGAVPVESLPHLLDTEPAVLRFVLKDQAADHPDIRVLQWEEFFLKFDALDLTFVYDENDGRRYEILQREEQPSHRHPEYRTEAYMN